ncbi:MAG: outer membrane beta-barrel protein [Acidobacteria bacterium]|nr:outer membrane beta-barrel protein [Acidobacteriota bacterium]
MLALVAAPAAAQQSVGDAGGRVYGLVGGGFGDGTFVATGAGAGLRLTPHLGLDLELTHLSGAVASGMPAHRFGGISVSSRAAATVGAPIEDFPALPVGFDPLFPTIHIEDRRRDVTTFLTRFTVEFPVADGRLFPYLTGGGGVGHVTERFNLVVDPIPWIPFDLLGTEPVGHAPDGTGTMHFFDSFISSTSEYSDLGLSLVLGGGVDVRLWRGLGIGIDVRWLRILRSFDALDTAQVTSRVSYRF